MLELIGGGNSVGQRLFAVTIHKFNQTSLQASQRLEMHMLRFVCDMYTYFAQYFDPCPAL